MTTDTSVLSIPQALEDWQPECALHGWETGGASYYKSRPCGRSATLKVVLHTECAITISCVECFINFSGAVGRARSGNGRLVCGVCGTLSDQISVLLKAVPL